MKNILYEYKIYQKRQKSNISEFGNTLGENQNLISFRYNVLGIRDLGTGNRKL